MDKTKINVLDCGYVQFMDSLLSEQDLRAVTMMTTDSLITPEMLDICHLCLVFKAPMFIKLALCNYGLTVLPINHQVPIENIEFYGTQYKEIKDSIIKELYVSGKTMASQSLLPIGTYIYFLVSGSLSKWISFINNNEKTDEATLAYIKEIKNIARTNWLAFDLFL